MKTLLILTLSLLTYTVSACECKIGYTMEENFKDASWVMEVEVIGIIDTSQVVFSPEKVLITASPPFNSGYAPILRVRKVYKGKMREKSISLSNTQQCGDRYIAGQKYVLFIYKGKGSYYTKICEKNFLASDHISMKKLKSILRSN
jgi:hypothetical protein